MYNGYNKNVWIIILNKSRFKTKLFLFLKVSSTTFNTLIHSLKSCRKDFSMQSIGSASSSVTYSCIDSSRININGCFEHFRETFYNNIPFTGNCTLFIESCCGNMTTLGEKQSNHFLPNILY